MIARLLAWARPIPRVALMRCHDCGAEQQVPVRAITVFVTPYCRERFAVTTCEVCDHVLANQIGPKATDLLLNHGARLRPVPNAAHIPTVKIKEIA